MTRTMMNDTRMPFFRPRLTASKRFASPLAHHIAQFTFGPSWLIHHIQWEGSSDADRAAATESDHK